MIMLLVVDYVFDLVYWADIIANFREPYTDDAGLRITKTSKIARRYLQTWFCFDLVACMPGVRIQAGKKPSKQDAITWLTSDFLAFHRQLMTRTHQAWPGLHEQLLDDLHPDLSVELHYFSNFAVQCLDHSFVTEVVSQMEPLFGIPGEVVLRRGDDAAAGGVFFVVRGDTRRTDVTTGAARLDVVRSKGWFDQGTEEVSRVVEEVGGGGFWGEIAAIFDEPQPADFCILEYTHQPEHSVPDDAMAEATAGGLGTDEDA
eukprot:gene9421-1071_t